MKWKGMEAPASVPTGASITRSEEPKKMSDQARQEFLDSFHRTSLSTTPGDAMMLRILIESRGAKRGVEVGAASGFGAMNMGIGFERTGGHLYSLEIDPERAKVTRQNVAKLGLADAVTVVEGDALQTIPELDGPIDFAFIDGAKSDYFRYFKLLEPKLAKGAVVVADNVIQYEQQMQDFLGYVQHQPNYETVIIRASMEKGDGMSVTYKLRKIVSGREREMEIAANGVRPRPPRPLLRGKDVAWSVYLYPGRWLARFLPQSWMYAVGDALVWFAPFALRAPRRRLMERLSLAFPAEAGSPRLERIARNYFRNAVRRSQDDLIMEWHAPERRPGAAELVNLENLTAALSWGHGALLISGHFFASRAAKRYLHSLGYSALSVRHLEPPDDWAGRLGKRFLQPRYVKFLAGVLGEEVPVSDPDSSLKMLARLRSNGLIDLHMDAPFSREFVRFDFLGEPRDFPTGFLHVAWIAGAPLVPLLCLGDSRRLRIEFGTPIRPCEWQDRARFVEEGLARMVKTFEEQVLRAPEQWDLWIRW